MIDKIKVNNKQILDIDFNDNSLKILHFKIKKIKMIKLTNY